MKAPAPLRFLAAVIGGWACFRAAMVAPGWTGDVAKADPQAQPPATEQWASAPAAIRPALATTVAAGGSSLPKAEAGPWLPALLPRVQPRVIKRSPPFEVSAQPTELAAARVPEPFPNQPPPLLSGPQRQFPTPILGPLARPSFTSRWSASAWAFVRRGEEPSLAAGGLLGGSQIGARLGYRINGDSARPLALSARFYAPLGRPKGAEAALGVEWKPAAHIPVRLLAERRQAVGREGRSAFALMAHGGVSDWKLAGPVRLNAYGQAGVVGIRRRDPFADGSASLGIALDEAERVTLGAGIWGAAQPGASRIDVGPSLSLRVPVHQQSIRISADWRVRVSGSALPGSGPALTIGTDF